MERPMLLPLLSTVIGLLSAHLFLFFLPDFLPFLLLLAAIPLLFLKSRFPFLLLLVVFFFSWGNISLKPYLSRDLPSNDVTRFASDLKYTIEGVVDSRPFATEKGAKVFLRTERIYHEKHGELQVSGRILFYVNEGRPGLRSGDRIRFISRISLPRNYGVPGEFDYVGYLAYRKVFATAFAASSEDVILIRRMADFAMQSRIDSLAEQIGQFISACVPGEEGFILRALLLGDSGGVTRESKEAFSKTGVNHILSISGFHVGIVSLFVFYLLLLGAKSSTWLMLHCNVRRLALVCTLPVVLFYLLLSGAAPATVRSVIMISAFVLAMLLEREVDPLNSLMLAALLIICGSPAALFDISFQLSFTALWGIIVITPLLISPFQRIEGTLRYRFLQFLFLSASATIATLPLVAHHFGRVSFTGLIANFVVVPLMGYGAVIIGFASLPVIFCWPQAAGVLIKVAAFLIKISNIAIFHLAALPTIDSFVPGSLGLIVSFCLLALFSFVSRSRMRTALCCALLTLFFAGRIVPKAMSNDSDNLRITFFSVGQGDSALVRFPGGKAMLIDGGGSLREEGSDIGARLLVPALRRLEVSRIDYVVLTHPHPDHMKGLKAVVEKFQVGEFWESGTYSASADYAELKALLSRKRIPVHTINSSTPPLIIGGSKVEPLSPDERNPSPELSKDENESSLVFRLVYGDFSVLFTGDMGLEAEENLLRQRVPLGSTILKVAHHGSRHSSSAAFIQAVSPETAVISAGYRNSFGLPSRQTLSLLDKRGVKVFRTDLDGTIYVVKNGPGYKIGRESENRHFN